MRWINKGNIDPILREDLIKYNDCQSIIVRMSVESFEKRQDPAR